MAFRICITDALLASCIQNSGYRIHIHTYREFQLCSPEINLKQICQHRNWLQLHQLWRSRFYQLRSQFFLPIVKNLFFEL